MLPDSVNIPLDYAQDNTQTRLLVRFFNTVYAWMFVGLAVTAAVGYAMSQSPAALRFVYGSNFGYIGLMLGAFLIANAVQGVALRANVNLATALFLLYASLVGVLLCGIFRVYAPSELAAAFLVTGGTFGAVSVLGFVTKIDLSRMGGILSMAVIGLIIASVANLFIASSPISWLITYAVLIVFIGLTAYETQQLKRWVLEMGDDSAMASRMAIVGSLMLYVAFINMFLAILRIMSRR